MIKKISLTVFVISLALIPITFGFIVAGGPEYLFSVMAIFGLIALVSLVAWIICKIRNK